MTARALLLVGAGGLGREAVELVHAINRAAPAWNLLGFLDDDPSLRGSMCRGVPVLGTTDALADHPDAAIVVTVASPAAPWRRSRIVERLALEDARFAVLVHPTAVIGTSCTLGPGSIVHAGTVMTADVEVGAHTVMMPGVVLTHDDVVGDHVTFGARAALAGGVTVGDGAYLGSGCVVREHRSVGERSVIGMGAVVTCSVPPGEVWAGVPAHRLRSSGGPDAGSSSPCA